MFAVLITGPPGSGKTSVLTALVDTLSDDDVPHAAVEVEMLQWAHPALSDDQWTRHLRALCGLYRDAGYQLALIAQTVEDDGDLARLLGAVGATAHIVVRLEAPPATLVARIIDREPAGWSGLRGLVDHAKELAVSMPALRGVDLVLSTDGQLPEAVAHRIRAAYPQHLKPTYTGP